MEGNETEDVHSSDSPPKTATCPTATSLVKADECDKTDDDGGESSTHTEHVIETKGSESEVSVALSLDCFDEEDWEDSVKKCKHRELDPSTEGEDSHHREYVETSDPQVEGIVKEMIRIMFDDGDVYRGILRVLLEEEIENCEKAIVRLQEPKEDPFLDDQLSTIQCREGLKNAFEKREARETKALLYFNEELDEVARDIIRKTDGVVRVQRNGTACRGHGTGTGVVVRINLSGTRFTPWYAEKDDFAILTNNHVVANDIEAKGATIDFFYNCSAGNKTKGQPPPGVITKSVTGLITCSPRVSHGTRASDEQMDFSILRFDVGTDEDFIKKLGDISFYLNEFPENDLITRPWVPYFSPLPLVAISHPHGSNKRISFGTVQNTELEKLCSEDNVDCSLKYNLTTCRGSSGCPVLAIQVNSRGHLKAVFQFLHFKTGHGIVVPCLYNACRVREEIRREYELFDYVLNCSELQCGLRLPIWWDANDTCLWSFY